jgi:hypothetical protein
MFNGFQNTNQNIKTTARQSNIFGGFQSQGLQSNLKMGRDGGVPETGLVARFRADTNITLNGSNVSAWSDFSNTYSLTQSTAASQPSYTSGSSAAFFNYQPCIGFTGAAKSLNISNTFGPDSEGVRTVLLVIYNLGKNPQINSAYANFSSATSSGTYYVYQYDGSFGSYAAYYNPPSATLVKPSTNWIGSITAQNTPYIIGCEVNRTAGKFYSYYGLSSYGEGTILTTLTNYSAGTFTLSNAGSTSAWYLAELLIYNTSLANASLDDRSQLYYYVRNRYGSIY